MWNSFEYATYSVFEEKRINKVAVYAADIGNGYAKRSLDGENVEADPSVYAIPNTFYKSKGTTISVLGGRSIYLGIDAFKSGYKVHRALGDLGIQRYESKEFTELLLGFMAKDLEQDSIINLLVLGLPNSHFKAKRDELTKIAKGKKVVAIGEDELSIEIKNTLVIPQPLGTYAYLEAEEMIDDDDRVLIIDGGFGTGDLTAIKSGEILHHAGKDIGMESAYKDIKRYLQEKYDALDIELIEIPSLLENGLKYAGDRKNLLDDSRIKDILQSHFDNYYSWIVEEFNNLKIFDRVIWTGGLSLAHKERIERKGQSFGNFHVLENAQNANALGFYWLGKSLLEEV